MSRSSRRTPDKNDQNEDPRILPKSTIAIVGGTGQMGRLLARLFTKGKHQVIICGRDEEEARKVAASIDAQAGGLDDLAKANIVVVSVPIRNTANVCLSALDQMTSNSLLVEISSVKSCVANKIAEAIPQDMEYLSLHPLFGPSARSLKGQNMIAIPMKPGPRSELMIKFLRDMEFNIQISSVEEHDRMMAVLQVMHHFAYLVMSVELARTIKTNQRISNFLTRSLQRTLGQILSLQKNCDTVFAIQEMNPYATTARTKFAESAQRMAIMNGSILSEIAEAMRIIRGASNARR